VDIYGDLSLRSSNGIPAQIFFGFDHAYQCVYELYGTKGVLRVPKAYTPRANYSPSIELTRNGVLEVHTVPAEDHFLTTLVHFRALIKAGNGFSETDWKRTMAGIRIQQEMRECALKNQST